MNEPATHASMTYSTAEGSEPRFVVSEGDSHLQREI